MRIRQVSFILFGLLFLAACQPRGETKSLDEVVSLARQRYGQSYEKASSQLDPAVSQSIARVQKSLEMIIAFGATAPLGEYAREVEGGLQELQYKVGYTTRPSLAELIKQYRFMGAEKEGGPPSAAAAKLLASRTFHLMASELETTRFAL